MTSSRILCALLFAAALPSAWSLDLLQAFEAAQRNDAVLATATAHAAAGKERLPQAAAGLLPNLALNASHTTNNLTTSSVDSSASAVDSRYQSRSVTLTLRQPLFNRAQRAVVRRAQAETEASIATLRREQQNMGLRLVGAYLDTLSAVDEVAQVAAQVRFYSRQLDASRKSFAGGAGTRTDVDEVQAKLDLALASQLQARQYVDFAQRRLQIMVGAPVQDLAPLNVTRLPLVPPEPGSLDDWVLRSERNSPEMAIALAQLTAATQEAARARAAHLPTLDGVVQWASNDRDNVNSPNYRYSNQSIGLQLNVPLYAGGSLDSQVRQADAEREAANQALEALRSDLGLRVHKEYRGVTDGVAKVRALEQAQRSADQVLLSTQKSYAAGSRSVIDVLNAEQQRATVQRDLAQARYVYLTAHVNLLALVDELNLPTVTRLNDWFDGTTPAFR